MGGKGGGDSMKWQQQAYDNAYSAAQQGQPLKMALQNQPNYAQATQLAYSDFAATKPMQLPEFGFTFPEMSGPSYEEQMADADARYQQQLADQERLIGTQQRDELYSNYMSAAGTATDYITGEIADEQANARLLGIDYLITDEQKSQRISDYFASIWSEGDQQRLEGLIGKWGSPTGFSGYSVTRGDASKYAAKKGEEKTAAVSKGMKPTLATEDEEETLGAGQTVLGV